MLNSIRILLILSISKVTTPICGAGCWACHPSGKCFVPDYINDYQIHQTNFVPQYNDRCNHDKTSQFDHVCKALHCHNNNVSFFTPNSQTCDTPINLISEGLCNNSTLTYVNYNRRRCSNPNPSCNCDSGSNKTCYSYCYYNWSWSNWYSSSYN